MIQTIFSRLDKNHDVLCVQVHVATQALPSNGRPQPAGDDDTRTVEDQGTVA